jgi:hypothetical protein
LALVARLLVMALLQGLVVLLFLMLLVQVHLQDLLLLRAVDMAAQDTPHQLLVAVVVLAAEAAHKVGLLLLEEPEFLGKEAVAVVLVRQVMLVAAVAVQVQLQVRLSILAHRELAVTAVKVLHLP